MKKILLLSSILLFTAAPSFGQITVFDPSNLKQQVQELINMSQQLTQLQKTFALYQQQFNLLNSEAQSLKVSANSLPLHVHELAAIRRRESVRQHQHLVYWHHHRKRQRRSDRIS